MPSITIDTPDNILRLGNKVRCLVLELSPFSHLAMNNLGKSNVFLSGLGGLGLEIGTLLVSPFHSSLTPLAKCVALAGSRSLDLHDTVLVTRGDLSSLYYATEADVGKNRAAVCIAQLQELNPYGMQRWKDGGYW
jgi:ubiquitin-activating enzyme E1